MPRTSLRRFVIAFVILLMAGGGAYYGWRYLQQAPGPERYRTALVDKGTIIRTVSANGTLNPVVLVNVGTQVSGTLKRLRADFNDRVKAGQVLAELDPSLLQAQLGQSRASVANAQASLKLAQANERRSRELYEKDYVARSDLDQATQALEVGRAQVATAQAQVRRDETNLGYAVIRSPVSGVVVSRNVDVGQTVAASFQTPTLFTIAQDLARMQIDTSVAEADVGGIRVGQPVNFTVDAFPDRQFQGAVKQVRLNATVQQNVVTYDVVIAVDNPEQILLPGMTAFVNVTVDERRDAVRIPLTALRFRPATETPASTGGKSKSAGGKTVYRLEGMQLTPVRVRLGISDNKYAELKEGNLKEGDALVVEEVGTNKKPETSSGFRMRMP
ncbi:MAG: efflux RND transporter periplasmic adaptor subunit [Gammaproteobacteria bacterium]|nr:efflux RND transporter periplasmic adaptor subunit [Gammaproteobacteria bacterium]